MIVQNTWPVQLAHACVYYYTVIGRTFYDKTLHTDAVLCGAASGRRTYHDTVAALINASLKIIHFN